MALPQNRRNGRQRNEVDVDALFASEPDAADEPGRPATPKLIFTQPADRNVQQFADEPVQFAEETVRFADDVDPLSLPLLSPPSHPYYARWNEPEPPRRLGFVLACVALLGAIGVAAAVVVVPRDAADLWARAAAVGLGRAVVPPAIVAPEAAEPAPVPPTIPPPLPGPTLDPIVPAPSTEAPASRLELQKPVTHPPQPSPVLRETPKAVSRERPKVAPTSGRVASAEPPVSTRGVTGGPSAAAAPAAPPSGGPSAPAAPAAPPTLDVRRPGSEGPVVVGQPLTPPRAVAAAPPMRDASPAPPSDPPSVAAGAAPVPGAPNAAVDPRVVETDRVRAVLSGYEQAYSALDADAASRVFPTVDRKALSRAFSGLSAQHIQFDDCRIQVQQGSARATCAGTARWTPKVGGGSQQQARRWEFALQQASTGWKIGSVRVQ